MEWTWTLLWTSPSSAAVVPFFQLWYGENGCLVSFLLNGWILLNVGTMPKILHYLIKVSMSLSNVRFSASFRRLEESTQLLYLVHDVAPVFQGSISCSVRGFESNLGQKYFVQTFSCFFFLEIQKGCS